MAPTWHYGNMCGMCHILLYHDHYGDVDSTCHVPSRSKLSMVYANVSLISIIRDMDCGLRGLL
jgi:hypothetical protein